MFYHKIPYLRQVQNMEFPTNPGFVFCPTARRPALPPATAKIVLSCSRNATIRSKTALNTVFLAFLREVVTLFGFLFVT